MSLWERSSYANLRRLQFAVAPVHSAPRLERFTASWSSSQGNHFCLTFFSHLLWVHACAEICVPRGDMAGWSVLLQQPEVITQSSESTKYQPQEAELRRLEYSGRNYRPGLKIRNSTGLKIRESWSSAVHK